MNFLRAAMCSVAPCYRLISFLFCTPYLVLMIAVEFECTPRTESCVGWSVKLLIRGVHGWLVSGERSCKEQCIGSLGSFLFLVWNPKPKSEAVRLMFHCQISRWIVKAWKEAQRFSSQIYFLIFTNDHRLLLLLKVYHIDKTFVWIVLL